MCKPGFMGQNCQLGLSDDGGAGRWWRVAEGNPYIPPRTGSAGVYLSATGSLYMFGGKNPSEPENRHIRVCVPELIDVDWLSLVTDMWPLLPPGFDLNRALGDLVKFNLTSNQWDSRSYGHSPVSNVSLLGSVGRSALGLREPRTPDNVFREPFSLK